MAPTPPTLLLDDRRDHAVLSGRAPNHPRSPPAMEKTAALRKRREETEQRVFCFS